MTTPARVNGGALPVVTTGRSLDMYTVALTAVHTNSELPDSLFEQCVRQLETVGTVEILGIPAAGEFRVAISGSSANATSLTTLVDAAVAGTVTVTAFTF
jgi:hypothetical protein